MQKLWTQSGKVLSKTLTNAQSNLRASLSTQKAESDVFSTNSNVASESFDSDIDITPNIPDVEESIEKEEQFRKYVERMRNVSRFSKKTAEGKFKKTMPTYSDNEAVYLKKSNYFRQVYSKYGKESSIEAGICWPTRQELLKRIGEEEQYDLTLKEKIDILIERKQAEIQNVEKMEKEVDDALNKMPNTIEKYYQNVSRKDIAEEVKKAKREEVMDQAREYYGFKVDLRDRRIKDMVDKLQEEKKKIDKAKKKEEEKRKFQLMKQVKVQEGENVKQAEAEEQTDSNKKNPSPQ